MLPSRADTIPVFETDDEAGGFVLAGLDERASAVFGFAFGLRFEVRGGGGGKASALPSFSGSYTTSSAFLSSRKPWNEACRRILSAVIRLYCTSATSFGFVQCTPFFETPFGKLTVDLLCSITSRRGLRPISRSVSKPVPTLPA